MAIHWVPRVVMVALSSPDAAGTSAGIPQEEVESALTDRYQTTVPHPVRRALGLRRRDPDSLRLPRQRQGGVAARQPGSDRGRPGAGSLPGTAGAGHRQPPRAAPAPRRGSGSAPAGLGGCQRGGS